MEGLGSGTRVRIRLDPSFAGPWPAEPVGTIRLWPDDGQLFRLVQHSWGGDEEQRSYWVEFDVPQYDTDGLAGGGPYRKVEVWERYLEILST